ncbi:uncharacterized protein DUF4926 [Asanoa ferruginea]|uniref:Uncharacterized protein DUF4926 n=1 Tax=Asanoa ferruginea TaxID=53367 RepID=A0A3D9ZWH8_9ACTN|nr:DUF4926 domain-containing protein [Asanoa ferruginea]REG00494.1 uncharacterized protein DUF4926 [Asanoa ferruginea]GIF47655.1 hypothetical protein Afe04nite_21940 [Asanoa ferruginea]
MTEIQLYDRVRVVTSRFVGDGVMAGMHGYVVEKYADGEFEVEVSDPATGETIALLTVRPGDVERDA